MYVIDASIMDTRRRSQIPVPSDSHSGEMQPSRDEAVLVATAPETAFR